MPRIKIIKSALKGNERYELHDRMSLNSDYKVVKFKSLGWIHTMYTSNSLIEASNYFNNLFKG